MPSNYAHYRFGVQALPMLPEAVQNRIGRYRSLYDVGLHGPDLFFYYDPLIHTRIGALGGAYHRLSGEEFFRRSVRRLRLNPTAAAQAYLYGVLGHFALDSVCHPSVCAWNDSGRAGHVEIEVEFDRVLLEKDGRIPPHTQDLTEHLRLNPEGWETIARFYPPAEARHIHRCLRNMVAFTRLLAAPEGLPRRVVQAGSVLAGEGRQMLMTADVNPRCPWAGEELMPLYDRALAQYPAMVRALEGLIDGKDDTLGPEFAPNFG